MVEIIPLWLVNLASFTTVFSVMTAIGTTLRPGECLEYVRAPSLLLKGIFIAIVIVPATCIAASFAFGLSLPATVGVALIAMAPGAPLALRRALGSGAHASFAPTLQIAIALLAVPAVPAWVMIGNMVFGTQGVADPAAIARQVFLAQLLPIGLGAVVKQAVPSWADFIGSMLGRAGALLLLVMILFQVVDLYQVILSAQLRPLAVAAVTTVVALLAGHFAGRPSPAVGHSIAVASALRNIGLALLIANGNQTRPAVAVAIITYALAAIVIVAVYIALWNRGSFGAERLAAPPG